MRAAGTDVAYSVVVSANLAGSVWTPLTNVVGVLDQGETEIVTVRDFVPAAVAPARFYQFRVTPLQP